MKKLTILLFIFLFIISGINLNSDPSFIKRTGDIDDEAHYGHNARTKYLFNDWTTDGFIPGITVVPLHSKILYTTFKYFGIGLTQLRIPSLIAGWLILIIIYLFTKSNLGEKQAIFTTALLGICNAFYTHIRLGRPENLLILFLLAAYYFFYLGIKKSNFFFFLSGSCLLLSFFSKFAAIFNFPAFIILYIFLRKDINLKNLVAFIAGGTTTVLLYIFLYLLPNYSTIVPYFLAVSKNNLFFPLYNLFWFFSNNFYGMPSVLIIFTLAIFYFLSKKDKYSILEISAISWLLGSIVYIFGDMSERRFYILLIPFVILASIHLRKQKLDIKSKIKYFHNILKQESYTKSLIIYLITLLPIFSLIYTFAKMILPSIFPKLQFLIFISYLILSLLIAKSKILFKFLATLSIFSIILIPLSAFIRQSVRHFLTITSQLHLEIPLGLALTAIAALILFIILIKNINLSKALLLIYVLINALLISQIIFAPTYSLYNNSKNLELNNKDVIISDSFYSAILSFENKAHPIWYFPFEYSDSAAYAHLHNDIESFNPRIILVTKSFDGKPRLHTEEWLTTIPFELKFLKQIELYPYPFTNKAKVIIDVYTNPQTL